MGWLEDLLGHAHRQLTGNARYALYERGVSDEQIEEFGLGCLDGLPPSLEVPPALSKWAKDGRLAGVAVFPLTNILGQVRGIQIRSLDRGTKNYQEFMLAKEEPILFGLGQAAPHMLATGQACLVEGVYDLFPIQRHVPFSVATLTAGVSKKLVRTLRRLVHVVWTVYDADAPGQEATEAFVKYHSRVFDIRPVLVPRLRRPDGTVIKDPGDLWELTGDSGVGKLIRPLKEEDPNGR